MERNPVSSVERHDGIVGCESLLEQLMEVFHRSGPQQSGTFGMTTSFFGDYDMGSGELQRTVLKDGFGEVTR